MKRPLPTFDRLHELFEYFPETGLFVRKIAKPPIAVGVPAFTSRHSDGYRMSSVDRVRVYAHRAAWMMTHGEWPLFIDHINGERADNRLANLRSVTLSQNSRNSKMYCTNKTGVPGVKYDARYVNKWLASITLNGENLYIGSFPTLEDATNARKVLEVQHGFHPNHGRR